MKASELQIGDWLWFQNKVNAFPFKVEQITKKKVGYHVLPHENRMYYLNLSEVQPIPLTEKIINNNSFKYDKSYHCWVLDESMNAFLSDDIDYKEDHTKIFSFDIMGEEDLLMVVLIKYVHEFQHILRLIGNNKEIEL